MIGSSGNATKLKNIPKRKSVSQSQLTCSKYAKYYAVRPEIEQFKYMSQKTMAFWAVFTGKCENQPSREQSRCEQSDSMAYDQEINEN